MGKDNEPKGSNVVRLRPVKSKAPIPERMDALDYNQKAIVEALEEIAETQLVTNRLLRKIVRSLSSIKNP